MSILLKVVCRQMPILEVETFSFKENFGNIFHSSSPLKICVFLYSHHLNSLNYVEQHSHTQVFASTRSCQLSRGLNYVLFHEMQNVQQFNWSTRQNWPEELLTDHVTPFWDYHYRAEAWFNYQLDMITASINKSEKNQARPRQGHRSHGNSDLLFI